MTGAIALAIKARTTPAHRIAERAVEAADPFASRAAYVRYLEMLRRFYSAVEPPLFARLEALLPEAARRRKLALVEADLAFFEVPPATVAPLPVPRIASDATAMGVAYVLEGKTLGSRFLLERARDALALEPGAGASFFSGYGGETGPMWRAYLAELGQFVERNGRRAAVLHGAEATFRAFTALVSLTSPVAEKAWPAAPPSPLRRTCPAHRA